ncbi:MAG: glycosyltransferase family 39 protein [Saprospiraceae bacterium]|nr:glycosyltransferase family 39 protein [Saprospiraceae bacterium]
MKTSILTALLSLAFFLLHVALPAPLGYHRDELLYLALGRRPDFGFWSNPPMIGALSWFSQFFLGDSVFATRLFPALAGTLLVYLTLRTVQLLGGGNKSVLITGVAMIASVAWQRAFTMLQPVPFDILCWGALSLLLVRWLHAPGKFDWLWIGLVAGLGMLNKYTLVFWAAALFVALLLNGRWRILLTKDPWIALAASVAVFTPNLIWQYLHHWPVAAHMQELAESQLQNVQPMQFLTDQLLMHGVGLFVWLPGLLFLLLHPRMQSFRLLAWFFMALLGVFLLANGKSYYTLGAFPVLFAAGGVCYEHYLKPRWAIATAMVFIGLLALPLAPAGKPIWAAPKLSKYFQHPALEGGLRWEDGKIHALPQDYADMLGWPEMAALATKALKIHGQTDDIMIYAENYGQAGAVELLGKPPVPVCSFSDSYRLWAPEYLPPGVQNMVYINDELGEDIQALFTDIQLIGSVQDTFAREFGTSVYLCRKPKSDFGPFWSQRVREVRADR